MDAEFAQAIVHVIKIVGPRNANHRVIAIVTTAYVEQYLTGLIKEKMPGLNRALSDRIFEGNGPLGTIAAKIDVARALKVIEPKVAENAVLIARIRNRFAHRLEVTSFDHQEVAPLVDKLVISTAIKKGRRSRRIIFVQAALEVCTAVMSGHVDKLIADLKKLEEDLERAPSPDKSEKLPRPHPKGRGPRDQ